MLQSKVSEAEAKRHFYERENAEQRIYVAIFFLPCLLQKFFATERSSLQEKKTKDPKDNELSRLPASFLVFFTNAYQHFPSK